MFWFLNKVHTELLTFCLSTVGLFAVLRGRFVGAMIAFAILATQSPSLTWPDRRVMRALLDLLSSAKRSYHA